MKRLPILLLCCCLLFPLCACSRKDAAPTPTPPVIPDVTAMPTEAPAPEPSAAPTPEPTPIPLIPDLPEVHDPALEAILPEALNVWPGAAGCSLRAARVAAWLLDWGAETKLTDDEIYSAVGTWMDEQDSERLKLFLESILSVYDQTYNLRGENAEALMSDAGVESSLYPWNERAFRAVEMVSYGCGLR